MWQKYVYIIIIIIIIIIIFMPTGTSFPGAYYYYYVSCYRPLLQQKGVWLVVSVVTVLVLSTTLYRLVTFSAVETRDRYS